MVFILKEINMATKSVDTESKVAFGKVEIDSYLTSRKPSGVKGGEVIKFPDNWKEITGEKVSSGEIPRRKINWGFTERGPETEGVN